MVVLKQLEDQYKADLQSREDAKKEMLRQAELARIREAELQRQLASVGVLQGVTRQWLARRIIADLKNPKKGKKGKADKGGKKKK